MRSTAFRPMYLLLLLVIALLVHVQDGKAGAVAKHPAEVEAPVFCSQCHDDWRGSLDHSPEFGGLRHKFSARQNKQTCGLCHVESFCSDCHGNKEPLKPSDKFKDAPERTLPHRGDYLNQHKIDGRVNPASCMKCHGRQNNERCRICHK